MTRQHINKAGSFPARSLLALLACAATLSLAAPAAAQTSGSLYSGFGQGGFAVYALGSRVAGLASVVQPDGKIVEVASATVNGTNVIAAVRLLSNGHRDTSFGRNGWAIVPISSSATGTSIALQTNGDILLGGSGRDIATGEEALAAVRLLANGRLDPSFGIGGIALVPVGNAAVANGIGIQSSGQIVLAGTAVNGHDEFVAARLNTNGTLDASFGSNGIELLSPIAAAWGLAIERDGSLVLGGEEQNAQGTWNYMAARLTANGTPDPGFGANGVVIIPIGVYAAGLAVTVQSDGKIILAGNVIEKNRLVATVRLLGDGSLDTTFGQQGIATFPGTGGQAVTMEGSKILLAGPGASAVRLNPDGSFDTTFGKRGLVLAPIGSNDAANGVVIDPLDNTILLAGAATINGTVELTEIKLYG
ncbi:MAG TPA: hypothetical protein VG410_02970 [Solirubrobacteraceae bacterium]|nr:hypothetical protein [Solirubrobacteraceae bacterium]